ncbi:hypothetical protein CP369_07945 [Lactobacillus sp. UMNPBX18]|nr:hypothetical protein CP369_07945 [Lactobacillus sp. UMNPBX18]
MKIKNLLRIVVFGHRGTSRTYIKYLRKKGVSIGKGCEIFRPLITMIDDQNPHLLSIGNYVQMTGPVTILTHDYSWSVLKRKYGYIYGHQQKTSIGNNIFIGWGATILAGSVIGDNVIIGANSVVSGKIEANSVYAGVPAKKIMTLKEYKEKRNFRQLEEALSYIDNYKKVRGVLPKEEKLDEYFFLFKHYLKKDDKKFKKKIQLMGNEKYSLSILETHKSLFRDYDDFLKYYKNKNNLI